MERKLIAFLCALLLLTLAAVPSVKADSDTYYVYTENGKSLNVRSEPIVSERTLVAQLPYGSKVQVLYFDGDWAYILYQWRSGNDIGYQAWVQRRFLVRNKPESRSSGTSKAAATTGQLGVLNREFQSLQLVNPFRISAKPVRSSGFVNLRWAPHEEAAIAGIAYYGHVLNVLASTTSWYQVEDPDTGKICFVMKKYTMIE